MSNPNRRTIYCAVALAAVLVAIDQFIKLRMLDTLASAGRTEIIRNLFYLTYVENRGAAFGIFQGHTTMLSILTGTVLVGVLVVLLSGRIKGRFLIWSLALVLAGGTGNLIDRAARGYVVDYLDFSALFGFPVFNFADCCVVVGTLLILCAIVWGDVAAKEPAEPDGSSPEA